MKSYDLKPTYQNLLKTYREDTIGRNIDLFRFVSILNSVEEGFSIALDGNWGSGKTFFVKQAKMILDSHNSFVQSECDEDKEEIVDIYKRYLGQNAFELQPQVCVYYDAWENDNDNDPVMSLVYSILKSVNSDFSFQNNDFIKKAASIMEVFTGKSWCQLIDDLRGSSVLDSLKEQKSIEFQVSEFLDTLLPEKGNRLVIFVDELDRCKPSYAVRLLERIKHYFNHDNITFVFSVNTNELQHTIKRYYGNDFDGSRYMDRFFDLRVALPPPNLQKFFDSISFDNTRYIFDVVCSTVIKLYHFELREISRFIQLTKIAAYTPTHSRSHAAFSDENAVQFCLCYVVPIMIGLKIQNTQRYSNFIDGKDSSPLLEVSKEVNFTIFNLLLGRNETFDKEDTSKSFVTLGDKLDAVYKAIFSTSYTGSRYHTMIGDMEFTSKTKDSLIRIAGLLSSYTEINIE